jgi:hypothetical protein
MTLSFGSGVNFGVSPSTYLEGVGTQCLIRLQGGQKGIYILGNTFLKNYYTVFDVSGLRVGFTPSLHADIGVTKDFPGYGKALIIVAVILILIVMFFVTKRAVKWCRDRNRTLGMMQRASKYKDMIRGSQGGALDNPTDQKEVQLLAEVRKAHKQEAQTRGADPTKIILPGKKQYDFSGKIGSGL